MLRRLSAILFSTVYTLSLQGGLSGAPPDADADVSFLFPAALESIEEDAFASTGASTLVFGENLRSIGKGAFFGTSLRDVFIPSAETNIADSAFPNNPDTTIHGKADSTARQWAEQHSCAFVPDGGTQCAGGGRSTDPRFPRRGQCTVNYDSKRPLRNIRSRRDREISMRPQDRPELNPIDYKFP